MREIDENHLHADPAIEVHPEEHAQHVAPPVRFGGATPMQRERARTIFQKGAPGRRAFTCPELDVPALPADALPERLRRAEPPRLPEVSEPEIVRHYVGLSKRNFDLDSGFYPLGSCTMKHNPRLHERAAALPGHARLHPLQDPERAQGALELMWRLQQALGEISGLAARQPAALGGLPRRARGRPADARLPRGPRRGPAQGADPGHRPWHEPGDGHDGRARGREARDQRRRRDRPRRPAREGG